MLLLTTDIELKDIYSTNTPITVNGYSANGVA